MHKLNHFLLTALLLSPLPSLAANLEVNQQGQETNGDLFIRNDVASIRISVDGSDIQGEAWSESSDSWSAATTIFTDAGDAFEIDRVSDVYELDDGTILLAYGDDVVSYSAGSGFQHFDAPFDSYKIRTSHNKANFVQYCSSASTVPQAALWSESGGFETATDLTDSICTEDATYFAGKKSVLVDYYSGVAYDINSAYAVIDTIDLSSLNYVDADDDWDAQGNNPDSAKKNNGDIAFGFEDSLYGYDYSDQVWRSLVSLSSGFTVANDGDDTGYALLQTEDDSNIFAFTGNADETEWEIYRWDSTAGWQLEKTYSFSNSAQLIRTGSDGSSDSLDWAFWVDSSNRLKIYQWTDVGGYDMRESRTAACVGSCSFSLDISRRDKAFVTWQESDGSGLITVAAWKPVRDVWDKTTLPGNASGFVDTHVTAEGRWIVQYQTNSDAYNAIRWTPDSGWSAVAVLQADQIYYDGDKLYTVTLSGSGSLDVERYVWSTTTSNSVTSISNVDTFYDDLSFIYDHYIFLDYLDGVGDYMLDDEAL